MWSQESNTELFLPWITFISVSFSWDELITVCFLYRLFSSLVSQLHLLHLTFPLLLQLKKQKWRGQKPERDTCALVVVSVTAINPPTTLYGVYSAICLINPGYIGSVLRKKKEKWAADSQERDGEKGIDSSGEWMWKLYCGAGLRSQCGLMSARSEQEAHSVWEMSVKHVCTLHNLLHAWRAYGL